jgi:putative transposase
MTQGLERWYGGQDLHFITCSCYHRRAELGSPERRDLFLRVLEQARLRYCFVVIGYVVMPEHFHLLITEPDVGDPSVVMKVIKERFSKLLHRNGVRTRPIWQKRFYDFNVARSEKRIEKLRYMHRNPVKRGLVIAPEEWSWSSFRSYAFHEEGPVRINCQEWPLKVTYSHQKAQSFHPRPRAHLSEKVPGVIERQRSPSSTHSSEPRG